MPIPPNFRDADESKPPGQLKVCRDCSYKRSDPKVLCIKYLAYVSLTSVCDSYEDIRKRPYPLNMQPFLSSEEKELMTKNGMVDLQHVELS